ncbi:protein Flattop [Thamnophis elegans]|uniref:protein Flattop n=1 Tax=Thamnophis elegans TaxID=35005 RepID=UPI001377A90F|nr:protein Flattop [Thamnophis elegans]
MATHFSSGQYEDAYNPRNLQSWSLPKVTKVHPSAREGFTQIIANDRGHLLPSIPRSKASPWGTYMTTWDMPLKIPPAKVSLTSRSIDAAARLTEWMNKSAALSQACNGLCPEIVGKPSIPVIKEAVSNHPRNSGKTSERPVSSGKMPAFEEVGSRVGATPNGPLSRQPGSMDLRLKDVGGPNAQDAYELEAKPPQERNSDDIPLSRQPGCMDLRLKDTSPQLSTSNRPGSREPTPRRTISAEAPPSGRPRSRETRPKGLGTPDHLSPCRPGSLEANPRPGSLQVNPRGDRSPEVLPPSRPLTKSRQGLEVPQTGGAERNAFRPLSST